MNTSNVKTYVIPVLKLSCTSCASSVQSLLQHQPGIAHAEVNFEKAMVTLSIDNNADLTSLKSAVQSIGYDLDIENAKEEKEATLKNSCH